MNPSRYAAPFADHQIRAVSRWPGNAGWRCARPGSWTYGYYVSWAPSMLTVGGDIQELVVRHYSFSDPWAAAAWVNGASWDYFMEKACAKKAYDAEKTAKGIIEGVYRGHRESCVGQPTGRDLAAFERITDKFGLGLYGDETSAAERKYACREMLSHAEAGEFSESDAYALSEDGEAIIYRYPEHYRYPYEALKIWAEWMWENEPVWHKILRRWRGFQAFRASLKSCPILWAPILYARFDADGKMHGSSYDRFYVWKRSRRDGDRYYAAVMPLNLFGRTWDRFGFWRLNGSSTPDREVVSPGWWRADEPKFRDIRMGDLA